MSRRNNNADRTILTSLSMNGRASLTLIGRKVGLTKQPTYRRIKKLERLCGIRYVPEINLEQLGYLKFLMLVKFIDKIPDVEILIRVLKKEPRVQFAMSLVGGEHDLIIYVLCTDNQELLYLIRSLARETDLCDYPSKWNVTPFYEHYGFVPLRNEFLQLLETRVLKRTRSRVIRNNDKKQQILMREFAVLTELNFNGAVDFTSIDRKYGFDRGRSQYAYGKLLEGKVLERITINMDKLPILYTGVIFVDVINQKKFAKTRPIFLVNISSDPKNITNTYSLAGDTGVPFGTILFKPVFKDGELEKTRKMLSKVKGIEIKMATVTKLLVGGLCYRLFDNAYSIQRGVLTQTYGYKQADKMDYFQNKHTKQAN
jgi:DNA-binding Lrp family transcriptional regulator